MIMGREVVGTKKNLLALLRIANDYFADKKKTLATSTQSKRSKVRDHRYFPRESKISKVSDHTIETFLYPQQEEDLCNLN